MAFLNINMIHDSAIYIIEGIWVTLQYTLLSVFLGAIIGTVITICRLSRSALLRYFAMIYVSLFRGTPLLVQLHIVYFVLPMWGLNVSIFMAGIISFSLNSAAYVSEIIRSGIGSIDKGQFEASRALSISHYDMMKDIILPQALRNILPSLVNEVVNLLKETAIISVIGGADIMRRAEVVSAGAYDYFTPLFIAAACYYLMVFIFSALARILEIKLRIR